MSFKALKWYTLIGLSLLSATTFFNVNLIHPSLSSLQHHFHVSVNLVVFIDVVYPLLSVFFMLIFGRLGDILGRRKMLYYGSFIFLLGAIGSATASSIDSLIFFAVVQALGTASIIVNAAALIPSLFPRSEASEVIGFYGLFVGLGLAISPLISYVLVHFLSWRMDYWLDVLLTLTGFFFCAFSLVEEPSKKVVPINWWSLVFLILGLGGLVYTFSVAILLHWTHAQEYKAVLFSLAALAVFIIIEVRSKTALMVLSVFSNKKLRFAWVLSIGGGVATYFVLYAVWLYVHSVLLYSAGRIAILATIAAVSQIILALFWKRLMRSIGVYRLGVLALLLGLLGSWWVQSFGLHEPFYCVAAALLLVGTLWGAANIGCVAINAEQAGELVRSAAMGTIFMAWNAVGLLGSCISAIIFTHAQKVAITPLLAKSNIVLTTVQQHVLQKLLAAPANAPMNHHQLTGPHAQKIFAAYQQAFLSGYHQGLWLAVVLLLVLLLYGVYLLCRYRGQAAV